MLKGLTRFLGPCLFLALLAVPMSVQAPAGAGQGGGVQPLSHPVASLVSQAAPGTAAPAPAGPAATAPASGPATAAVARVAAPGGPAGSSMDPGAAAGSGEAAVAPQAAAPPQAPVTQHTVRRGETLWSIARQYRLSVKDLAAMNRLSDPDRLLPGQRLLVVPGGGSVHRVEPGDTVWRLARRYGVEAEAIVGSNGLSRPDLLAVGQVLVIPAAAAPRSQGSPVAQAASHAVGLDWPLRGRLTSYFGPRWGRRHSGVDIAAPFGASVRAAQAGLVKAAGWMGGYGRAVVIEHAGGVATLYGHASRLLVRAGQRVARGEVVAKVGSTGNSTGPHLHFEVVVAGKARNPLNYLGSGD